MSSSKRSADTVSSSSSAGDGIGRSSKRRAVQQDISSSVVGLPATAWAGALDFLPYHDVRTARLVSKLFALEVPKHIETLSIFQASEMDVPSARQYSSVTSVNIFCLLKRTFTEDGQYLDLIADTFGNIIPFLQIFSLLKFVFLGGRCEFWHRENMHAVNETYDPTCSYRNENHLDMYRNFVDYLCSAFKKRALSQDFRLKFIVGSTRASLCNDGDNECMLCKKIFETFPLRAAYDYQSRCTSEEEKFAIISKRPGGKEYLESPELITYLLQTSMCSSGTVGNMTDEAIAQIQGKYSIEKEIATGCLPYYIDPLVLKKIKGFVARGNDPRKVNMSAVIKEWDKQKMSNHLTICKTALKILMDLDFDVSPNENMYVMDEKDWPKLEELIKKVYNEFL